MTVHVYWEAERDLFEQITYFLEAGAQPDVIERLLDAVEEVKRRIGENPQTWSFAMNSRRVQKLLLRGFRIQVFYQVRKDGKPVILEFAGPGRQTRWAERLRRTNARS